jgi:uncharacterized protein
MDNLIIPEFKQGRFSEGIVSGVEGLDKMARKLELPSRPRPWWHYLLIVGQRLGLALLGRRILDYWNRTADLCVFV